MQQIDQRNTKMDFHILRFDFNPKIGKFNFFISLSTLDTPGYFKKKVRFDSRKNNHFSEPKSQISRSRGSIIHIRKQF